MKILKFFKERWNLLLYLSLSIVALLTQIVVPPKISLYVAEGSISYQVWARFVVMSALLIFMYPSMRFNKKKHGVYWWATGLVCLVSAILFYFNYNDFSNRKTAYNEDAKKREVIGDHLSYWAQQAVEKAKRDNHLDSITPDRILESVGPANEDWPVYEIAANSSRLSVHYLKCILAFTVFLACCVQAVYCAESKR